MLPPSPIGLSSTFKPHYASIPSPLSSQSVTPQPSLASLIASAASQQQQYSYPPNNASNTSISRPSTVKSSGKSSRNDSIDTTTSSMDRNVVPNNQSQSQSQSQTAVTTPSTSAFNLGPPLRPLDLGRLNQPKDVYEELGKTSLELGQWLDVVGAGLDDLLAALPPQDAVTVG